MYAKIGNRVRIKTKTGDEYEGTITNIFISVERGIKRYKPVLCMKDDAEIGMMKFVALQVYVDNLDDIEILSEEEEEGDCNL